MTTTTSRLRAVWPCCLPCVKTGAFGSHAGFSLVSAIFLLVVLAVLRVGIVRVSSIQSVTSTQDLQGSRAYHAARAGAEWGVFQVMDPDDTLAAANPPSSAGWPGLPACPASPTVMVIEGFTVSVTCAPFGVFNEAGNTRSIQVYQITSNARVGATGTLNAIEREVVITVSKCRTTDGIAADFYRCS